MTKTMKTQPLHGYRQAQDLIAAGAKVIPVAVVRRMIREWNQENNWTTKMAAKIQAALDEYAP